MGEIVKMLSLTTEPVHVDSFGWFCDTRIREKYPMRVP